MGKVKAEEHTELNALETNIKRLRQPKIMD